MEADSHVDGDEVKAEKKGGEQALTIITNQRLSQNETVGGRGEENKMIISIKQSVSRNQSCWRKVDAKSRYSIIRRHRRILFGHV